MSEIQRESSSFIEGNGSRTGNVFAIRGKVKLGSGSRVDGPLKPTTVATLRYGGVGRLHKVR